MAITRRPITKNPGVLHITRISGEFLHFTLTASGPLPIFSANSSVKGTLFEAPDFTGHPKRKYEWDHLKDPSDRQALELLDLHMAFITCKRYRYKVDKRAADGTVVATIMDLTFAGEPIDHGAESILLMVR